MKVFTAAQMREFDRVATEEYGIPSIVLMENAALRVVEFLEAKFAPLSEKRIVILCGKGNNGGDGLAIARHLASSYQRATKPNFNVIIGPQEAYKKDAGINRQIWEKIDGQKYEEYDYWYSELWPLENEIADESQYDQDGKESIFAPVQYFDIERTIVKADIIVDAVLGTGFTGSLKYPANILISCLANKSGTRVCVDLPSGLNADTGQSAKGVPEDNWRPHFTVTFAGPKRGLFLCDGPERSGEVWIGDIGNAPYQMTEAETGVETLDLEWAKSKIPARPIDAHKGDAGRALVIGGSFGMSGAVALACKAALKIGVGLCTAAIPEKILPIFASSILEATSHPLACDGKGFLLEAAADDLAELWKNVNVVALGPGIGRTPETQKFVARVVRECPKPLVIDADALHALPDIAEDVKNREAETILTPHPGEMGTLMGISAKEVNEQRFQTAEACAQKYGAIVVLKGARSLVATPDGQTFVNLTGNSGMATGGSGDVLTGTIAGLLAQMKHAEDATKLGVYIHGYAGDIAFRTLGNGLTAVDILEHLPLAIQKIKMRQPEQINGRLRKLE